MKEAATTISNSLVNHQYPNFLIKYPGLISIVYFTNWLLQLRKWYVWKAIKKNIPKHQSSFCLMDIGCGEAQYIFPLAKKNSQINFIGIDKNEGNVRFFNSYTDKFNIRNCRIIKADIEFNFPTNKADLILNIGVLQYIKQDDLLLSRMYNSLSDNGKLLLYVPINGRFITTFYKYIFTRYLNYEKQQNRQRVYTANEIKLKLNKAGFVLVNETYSYNTFGIVSNEIINSFYIAIANFNPFARIIACLGLIAFIPFNSILMMIDFLSHNKTGNGLLVTAVKGSR